MSRSQRLALIAGAVVVAVAAFLIARPGGDEEDDTQRPAARTTPTETQAQAAPPKPKPQVVRIQIRDGSVVGGAKTIDAERGEAVRIVVASDAPDELHLHGFDITRPAAPGKPARFAFKANIEGSFELESHTAEDAGRDPLVARVEVAPS